MRTIEEIENNSPLLVEVYDNVFSDDCKWETGRTTGNVRKESEEIEVDFTYGKTEYYHLGDEVRFPDDEA